MENFNEKWMNYFFKIAQVVSEQSKDPSTKVGAVIVTSDKQIVSTGYNGFPVGIDDSEEKYNDRPTKLKYVVHAEANAITRAAKQGIKLNKCSMFVTLPPCMNCAKLIIQSGINQVCFLDKTGLLKDRRHYVISFKVTSKAAEYIRQECDKNLIYFNEEEYVVGNEYVTFELSFERFKDIFSGWICDNDDPLMRGILNLVIEKLREEVNSVYPNRTSGEKIDDPIVTMLDDIESNYDPEYSKNIKFLVDLVKYDIKPCLHNFLNIGRFSLISSITF